MKKIFQIGSSIAGVFATIGSILAFFPSSMEKWKILAFPRKLWCGFLILVCIALIVNSMTELSEQVRYHHRFVSQSKQFNKYFSKWYRKPGKLCIICDDLNWTRTGGDTRIYDQLVKKCNPQEGLLLLLGSGIDSPIVRALQKKGAVVRPGPKNVIAQFSFSCVNVMGNQAGKAIVRNKKNDQGDKIVLDEIRNKYVTELLNSLINDEGSRTADAQKCGN